MAAGRKSGLKPHLSQNLMTFWASVQRLVAGGFGEKAVYLGEQKLVVRWVLKAKINLSQPLYRLDRYILKTLTKSFVTAMLCGVLPMSNIGIVPRQTQSRPTLWSVAQLKSNL